MMSQASGYMDKPDFKSRIARTWVNIYKNRERYISPAWSDMVCDFCLYPDLWFKLGI